MSAFEYALIVFCSGVVCGEDAKQALKDIHGEAYISTYATALLARCKLTSSPFLKLVVDGVAQSAYVCRFCPFFDEHKTAVQDHESGHFVARVTAAEPGYAKCRYCTFVCLPGSASLSDHVKFHEMTVDIFQDKQKPVVAIKDGLTLTRRTRQEGQKNSSQKRGQAHRL
jgi:hypothetical protein